jgi:hypothetical protein
MIASETGSTSKVDTEMVPMESIGISRIKIASECKLNFKLKEYVSGVRKEKQQVSVESVIVLDKSL